jgi:hypothetical protein
VIKTKFEKSTIRKLIDQIDQTRVKLDLTKVNENQSNLIDQVHQSLFVSLTFKAITSDNISIKSSEKSIYSEL